MDIVNHLEEKLRQLERQSEICNENLSEDVIDAKNYYEEFTSIQTQILLTKALIKNFSGGR